MEEVCIFSFRKDKLVKLIDILDGSTLNYSYDGTNMIKIKFEYPESLDILKMMCRNDLSLNESELRLFGENYFLLD